MLRWGGVCDEDEDVGDGMDSLLNLQQQIIEIPLYSIACRVDY